MAVNQEADANNIRNRIDHHLKILNDDYRVERGHALKEVIVEVLPHDVFLGFMEKKGKLGSQHKFPRVLKGKMLEDWNEYLKEIKK